MGTVDAALDFLDGNQPGSGLGQVIRDHVTAGRIKLMENDSGWNVNGGTDYDTISVDTDHQDIIEIARTLCHEYMHWQDCRSANSNRDSTNSPFEDVANCTHAQFYADSAWELCSLMETNPQLSCKYVEDANTMAQEFIDTCVNLGGTPPVLPDPQQCGCCMGC
jgi:hypothetical protein